MSRPRSNNRGSCSDETPPAPKLPPYPARACRRPGSSPLPTHTLSFCIGEVEGCGTEGAGGMIARQEKMLRAGFDTGCVGLQHPSAAQPPRGFADSSIPDHPSVSRSPSDLPRRADERASAPIVTPATSELACVSFHAAAARETVAETPTKCKRASVISLSSSARSRTVPVGSFEPAGHIRFAGGREGAIARACLTQVDRKSVV